MNKTTFILFFSLISGWSVNAQLVINEVDSDTKGIDNKEFIELKSDIPYFSLDGMILALFNGNPTSSDANRIYHSIDLNGLKTDINGLVLIGNNGVSPVPSKIIADNTIQNGPDAVAIYKGNISDFPIYKVATKVNLVHALAYSNNSSSAKDLMDSLGLSIIYNENQFGDKDNHSIQRKSDGTYEVKLSTPGVLNDGGGVTALGISIEPQNTSVGEGEDLEIIFRVNEVLKDSLRIEYSLKNSNFNESDFKGPLFVVIPKNTDWASVVIEVIDDGVNEGDEEMVIAMNSLPNGFVALNNNLIVRIIDKNYSKANWGTPVNPTYGEAVSTQPIDYYAFLNNKSGEELRNALKSIIADDLIVRKHTYGDVVDILKISDQNPENSSEVWLMYLEKERSKLDYQLTSNSVGTWNREHIFPQSRGGFAGAMPTWSDGINKWESTNADDLSAAHSDAHHIRATDGPENSSRGNKSYGSGGYNGPTNTKGSWKGDVARSLFYMSIRYNDLDVSRGFLPTSTSFKMGDLDALLEWHKTDKADDFEMNRNNVIYEWQKNRNPFIDMPELADYIWGEHAGDIWNNNLSIKKHEFSKVVIYPNPATEYFYIQGVENGSKILIKTLAGEIVLDVLYNDREKVPVNFAKGMYIVTITSKKGTETVKLLVN
ncbi:endonuclease [Myroides guanonis]|uniref:Por secretion system C-terminal sorting domain-containing protein n=1 Tax=Myroides guanonis TaxID=1150112 RepID=A0A1I3QXA4_9FLAO|nr:endonuclease [Myroides guanonis]SFJ37776.1 Por secretion system C-terminal sorting domain-containing protein [Myroides guanonis]